MELELSQQIFDKCSNIKFQENPPSGSQVVSRRRRDMTRLTVTFHNFANVPKNHFYSDKWHLPTQMLKSYNYSVLPCIVMKSLLILKQQLITSFTESTIQIGQLNLRNCLICCHQVLLQGLRTENCKIHKN